VEYYNVPGTPFRANDTDGVEYVTMSVTEILEIILNEMEMTNGR